MAENLLTISEAIEPFRIARRHRGSHLPDGHILAATGEASDGDISPGVVTPMLGQ
jgi:hypothetical protein